LWPKKEERRVIFLPKFGGLKFKKKKTGIPFAP
jgi:hypothetical protein